MVGERREVEGSTSTRNSSEVELGTQSGFNGQGSLGSTIGGMAAVDETTTAGTTEAAMAR